MDAYDKVALKCAEELNELATRLLQQVNKSKGREKAMYSLEFLLLLLKRLY